MKTPLVALGVCVVVVIGLCGVLLFAPVSPPSAPGPLPTATDPARPVAKLPSSKPAVRRYASCAALRADYPAGVPSGHPSYRRALDRDRDGMACEPA